MRETWVGSLGRDDPLEEGMAIHSSILAWEIPWTEEPGGLHSPWGRKRIGHNYASKQQQQMVEKKHTQEENVAEEYPPVLDCVEWNSIWQMYNSQSER